MTKVEIGYQYDLRPTVSCTERDSNPSPRFGAVAVGAAKDLELQGGGKASAQSNTLEY